MTHVLIAMGPQPLHAVAGAQDPMYVRVASDLLWAAAIRSSTDFHGQRIRPEGGLGPKAFAS